MNLFTVSYRISHVAKMTSVVLLLAGHTVLAQIAPVPSRIYVPPDAQNGRFAEAPAFRGSGIGQVDYHISAITPDSTTVTSPGVPRKTGVVHVLPDPIKHSTLYWERTNNGFAARLRITANAAKGLRIHLSFANDSPLVEFRIQGNLDVSIFGPVTGSNVRDREIWLPIASGTETILEIYFPDEESMGNGNFTVDQVNYIFGAAQLGQFANTGAASYPEYDAACYSNNPDYALIQTGVAATAKISFLSNGASYICSGTLLNDRGSTTTPWFATANHCIPSQTVASTMIFFWHYEATMCGGYATDSRYRQTYGGAQLLWSDVTYDAAFLKLNSPPGPYTVFAGWNSGSLSIGGIVYGIHHPKGDHTMISVGFVTALDASITSANTGAHLTLNKVNYTYGGVEGGSSGSGVFAIQNGGLRWKGALFGDSPSNYQAAAYGPFDNFYNNVKQYLENTATQSPVDTQPPTVPTGLVVYAVSTTQVTLYWTASTDNFAVTTYKVYRQGALIATLGNVTSYSNTGLASSANYSYTVSACDAAGNCSAQSASASVTTLTLRDTQPPTVPTGLTATPENSSQVNLAWTYSTDSLGVTAYKVYRNGALIATLGNVTSYSDTGLTASTAYRYFVVACNAAGNCSAQSTAVSAITQASLDSQAPTVPLGFVATAISTNQINLAWNASTDNVAVTQYKIYQTIYNSCVSSPSTICPTWYSSTVLLTTLDGVPPLTSHRDLHVWPSTKYSYVVLACDAAGNCSAQSSIASVTTPSNYSNNKSSFSASATGGIGSLTLVGNIQISTFEAGANGVIYVAAQVNGFWYFKNASGGWVAWTGETMPAYFSGALNGQTIPIVLALDAGMLIGTKFYVGYGQDETDMVRYGKYSLIYTIGAD